MGITLDDFDFESSTKRQLNGNIYLAKVTRVEPSLQAAFVEYGGNRHGFLAFSEIHPDYYQIPQARSRIPGAAENDAQAKAAEHEPTTSRHGGGRATATREGRPRMPTDADEETADMVDEQAAPPRPPAAQLQDPGGDQAPADHAGAGRQGGARQQGRGADHLSVARRPLLRADAEHAARRRHQPQDHQRHRPPPAQGHRRRARDARRAWA